MIYIPFIGALALGVGTIWEKILLRKKKMDIGTYQTISFLSIIILMLPLLFFFWKLDSQIFELKNILIFLGIIICAVVANIFALYSLKGDKVTKTEPARVIEPVFVILIALILSLFIEEFETSSSKFILPALIAGLAIIFPHIKKGNIKFNKYFTAALIASFLFALELTLSDLILSFFTPISFYLIRCVFIFVISAFIFKPKLTQIDKKTSLNILLIGIVWISYRIAVYFGYIRYGVMFTTLITMMAPIMIYLLASIFLKEKLNWKNILSSIIITGCVIYSVLI